MRVAESPCERFTSVVVKDDIPSGVVLLVGTVVVAAGDVERPVEALRRKLNFACDCGGACRITVR